MIKELGAYEERLKELGLLFSLAKLYTADNVYQYLEGDGGQ